MLQLVGGDFMNETRKLVHSLIDKIQPYLEAMVAA